MKTFRFLWFYQQRRHNCWSKVITADSMAQAITLMEDFLAEKARSLDVMCDHLVVTDDGWESLTNHPFKYAVEWNMTIYPSGFFPQGKNQVTI